MGFMSPPRETTVAGGADCEDLKLIDFGFAVQAALFQDGPGTENFIQLSYVII